MVLKLSNFDKPSNKRAKRIADFFLYTLPLYSVAIAAVGDQLFGSPRTAMWVVTGINILVITLKGLTKFTSETAVEPVPEEEETTPETKE